MNLLFGLVGTALLIIAVNLPILQDPAIYQLHGYIVPFWQYGDHYSSAALILIVTAALFLTLLRKYRLLWLPAVGALIVFAYIIITPFRAVKKTGYFITPRFNTLTLTSPLIGWWLVPILFLGPLLLILAAVLRNRRT